MGGYFLRLVHAVPAVAEEVDILATHPPPWASSYADKICSYLRHGSQSLVGFGSISKEISARLDGLAASP
eukprot:1048326-Pyramimonas_sp.AAC.1